MSMDNLNWFIDEHCVCAHCANKQFKSKVYAQLDAFVERAMRGGRFRGLQTELLSYKRACAGTMRWGRRDSATPSDRMPKIRIVLENHAGLASRFDFACENEDDDHKIMHLHNNDAVPNGGRGGRSIQMMNIKASYGMFQIGRGAEDLYKFCRYVLFCSVLFCP